MKMRSIAFLLLVTSFACKPNQNSEQLVDASLGFFTPNPEPVAEREVETLRIGESAPDFRLPSTDGRYYSLEDFANAEALAIVFTCNHCPTAQAYEDRLVAVTEEYRDKGLQVVAISPNSPLGLLYEELGYSDLNDDFEEMVVRAEDYPYNFPYLYDGDNQEVSLQYGPVATPHVFLFDKDRKLAYVGRIDGKEKPGTGNAEDFRNAIDAVLGGTEVENPVTKTFGCSTKWGWKLAMKERVNKEWSEKPVSIDDIDVEGIQNLLKNEDSDKLRLINVWATWCGPCVIEYPQFVVIQRMFGARDFEFVSLSADNPNQREKALKFLEDKESALINYLFSTDDKYALIEAIGNDWNGALPYTILVEPGGEVVWKHQGEVDFYELKKVIVEHEMIGRYY